MNNRHRPKAIYKMIYSSLRLVFGGGTLVYPAVTREVICSRWPDGDGASGQHDHSTAEGELCPLKCSWRWTEVPVTVRNRYRSE
jgi:hypothetical protein